VSLKITILPPFWKTRTAFVLYIVLVLGILMVTRKLIQQRERMKFAIEQERQEAQRMHELDMMKIRFFTNVSHEFRTPLTLILTPLERILKNTKEPDQQNQFQLIHRNAKRLLNLVNQLLDFRKLEVQEIKFNPSEGDIVRFLRDTVYSFSDLSEKKDIRLEFKSSLASLDTVFDQDKLEKILFNLLSNAFKFTPEHGSVTVTLDVVEQNGAQWIEIKVSDTGIGIPADKQENIFERFFQHDLPKSMVNQGSGIGLSITKEFVKSHEGTISVESEPGRGSCFTVRLPVKDVRLESKAAAAEDIATPEEIPVTDEEVKQTVKLPTLLLVEDNEDFRFYLKDNLKLHYQILEAKDGKEGWTTALSALPDLIVSDVMMPEMNGLELCRKIKNDSRVSHIPVILLTARTAEEQKLEGFETGADDYITKPFNFEILQSRIRNLIHQRELFQKEFRKHIDVKASDLKITSLDEKLIRNAIACVESKISDPDFSVEDLSRELGMSRVYLYKKLLALTGKSPLEFIRTIRLQHAAQMLEKGQLTVSEVAYKVGFNNPKYFTKYFKEEYHMLPSLYAGRKRTDS
jgi:signal transduction histidine kinase/DNA-binding response OmpR family regulator